jgi:hypothetical protein
LFIPEVPPMTLPKKKLLSQIENLREQLNKQVDANNNIYRNVHTLELSRELDRLIFHYTEKYLKNP